MQIYPAIDVKDGRAVRLRQGRFDNVTVFNDDPVDVAGKWKEAGASYIHLVDLDGAKYGKSFVINMIENIKKKYDILIQTGGGVRNAEDIEKRINAGADRIIIGTAAVRNPEFVKQIANIYGDKIAVGVDAKNGMAAISGWEEVSNITAVELCLKMKSFGIKTIIYTDILKDGMMNGPNIESTKELIEKTGLNIIASGGISSMRDLENIKDINASGAIIGRAIYAGAVSLKEAIECFEKKQ